MGLGIAFISELILEPTRLKILKSKKQFESIGSSALKAGRRRVFILAVRSVEVIVAIDCCEFLPVLVTELPGPAQVAEHGREYRAGFSQWF